MKLNAVRIVEFTNPSGATVFRVDGKDKSGKRVRENFKTRPEAQRRKSELENELANLPVMPMVSTRLTPDQIAEAERVFAELAGKSLTAAARYYIDNYREPVTKIAFEKALEQFMDDKRRVNCRPRTLENLKNRIGAFARKHPGKLVSDIQPADVSEYFHRPGVGPLTKNTDLTVLSVFFNWAVDKGFRESNPCAKIERIRYDSGEVAILPVADVRKLLNVSLSFKGGVLVPYVTLATFCALRPAELARLSWNDIDLEGRQVRVIAGTAKTRSRRVVQISENCAEWLASHSLKKTPIVGPNWRRDFDALKRLAGFSGRADAPQKIADHAKGVTLKEWPADVLRHTGGSHHLALYENEAKTAHWMGNSVDVIAKHYKALVSKSDTEAFWKITPNAENIIKLERAA